MWEGSKFLTWPLDLRCLNFQEIHSKLWDPPGTTCSLGEVCVCRQVCLLVFYFILFWSEKHTSYYARFSYFCRSCQDTTINSAFTFNSFKPGTFYSTFLLLNYFSLFLKMSFTCTVKSDYIYPHTLSSCNFHHILFNIVTPASSLFKFFWLKKNSLNASQAWWGTVHRSVGNLAGHTLRKEGSAIHYQQLLRMRQGLEIIHPIYTKILAGLLWCWQL